MGGTYQDTLQHIAKNGINNLNKEQEHAIFQKAITGGGFLQVGQDIEHALKQYDQERDHEKRNA